MSFSDSEYENKESLSAGSAAVDIVHTPDELHPQAPIPAIGTDGGSQSPLNPLPPSEWCGPCGHGLGDCHSGLTCLLSHCLNMSSDTSNCHPGGPCPISGILQCLHGTHCSPCGLGMVPCARGHSCVHRLCVMQGFPRNVCDKEHAHVCEPCDAQRKCEGSVCKDRNGIKKCRKLRCLEGFCAVSRHMAEKRCRRKILKGGRVCESKEDHGDAEDDVHGLERGTGGGEGGADGRQGGNVGQGDKFDSDYIVTNDQIIFEDDADLEGRVVM